MKHNVVYFISVLLLTFAYFTGAVADEKIRMAIMGFKSDTVPQKGVLTDLLRAFARDKTKKYQIVTADNSIKSAISCYKSELAAGITPKLSAMNSKKVSAKRVLIPGVDLFGDTYLLTALIKY